MAKSLEVEKEEAIIKELCTTNGIQYAQLEGNGPSIKLLEMFFSGYPHMVGLEHFPNLTVLVIVGQTVEKIQGVEFCPELKELWICECKLKSIHGLEESKKLCKLYLYCNQIKKIENLSHLSILRVLDLSKNALDSMHGVANLKSLHHLNLAANSISLIGHNLDPLVQLSTLNLAGNQLSSFKDLTNLMRLPALKNLRLKDPLFRNNPVCLLCNYSTHVLYHLSHLEKLDAIDVSSSQMRDLAQATVVKKKMYYHMRVKTVRRNLVNLLNRLNREKKILLQLPEEKLKTLFSSLKSIEQQRDLDDDQKVESPSPELSKNSIANTDIAIPNGLSDTNTDVKLKKPPEVSVDANKTETESTAMKLESLNSRIIAWNKKIEEVDAYHRQACNLLHNMANTSIRRLVVELESGGNVRFEHGSNRDVWFTTCHDLALSRFCAWDYKSYDVTGLKIHGITRIHNRVLRSRFDDKVHTASSDDSGLPSNKNYKKLVDYLFFTWNPKLPAAKLEFNKIVEDGFTNFTALEGQDEGVALSNSLFISDKLRIDHLIEEAKSEIYADSSPFRYGKVIVCKVYLGKGALAQTSDRIIAENYSKIDSVYRPRRDSLTAATTTPLKIGEDCDCSTRQCEWSVFDPHLVLPEYIIDFEYIAKKPKSPFQIRLGDWISIGPPDSGSISASYDMVTLYGSEEEADRRALDMVPKVRVRPRLVSLSEDVLLKLGRQSSLSQITSVNLHMNGLSRLKGIAAMSHLKYLVVSFNELTRLDDVAYMSHLERIDASYNKVNSLEGMRGMSKIRELDLSWNQLTSLRDDLTVLRKHSPTLNKLDLRNNPWIKADYLFLRVIGRLKSLTKLNGTAVTETDAAAALRLVSGTRVSQTLLGLHSRCNSEPPNSLNLGMIAHVIGGMSRMKPDVKDPSWMSKVTSLNLDGQFIGKLSGLERLVNLKWVSLDRNCVTKFEGIEHCTAIQELSIQDNCVYKLDGLSRLTKLEKLDLSSNYISSLDNAGFDSLPSLVYLSLENNRISSLKGLSTATSLIELYVGNNRINILREVFHIKSLVILDLYGNPLAQSDNYRLFVVYHLHNLKALDGNAVDNVEESSAKDAFGGRLTYDFVAERIGHSNFQEVRELDFPSCAVRTIDMGNGEFFKNLRSVNLEHNNLTSFSGLIHLRFLRVLCLNHNHVESVTPRPKNQRQPIRSQYAASSSHSDQTSAENLTPLMESLEVLHLGYNKITSISALQLGRLVNLKALFMQGNEITKIEGLESLHELRELVLDRNKVKLIGENSFVSQWNLQELHLEENRLRDLSNLHHLENLQRLYLGMNRIQDMLELEKLESLPNLIEVSLIGNAVSRRLLHRPMLVFQLSNLQNIDGIPVSVEERTKAELYFMDQRPVLSDNILPGITPHNRAGPIKVTHMSIGNERYSTGQTLTGNYDDHDKGKRSLGRDKGHHHSLTHGALYNQIAGVKYQGSYNTTANNRGLGNGNR